MALREVLTILAGCTISLVVVAGCDDGTAPRPIDAAGPGVDAAPNPETKYTLTIAAIGDGTTEPAPGPHVYPAGTSIAITAMPQSSSTFMGWSGDASGANPPITVVVDGNKTVTAQFSWARSPVSGIPNLPQRGVPRPSGTVGNLNVLDWAGFKGAVSYTFDDSQPSHVQHYAALQATGIRMTFYVNKETAMRDVETWRKAVADGHEIGNHTVSHCRAPTTTNANLTDCGFGPATPNPPAGATPESEIDDNTAWIRSTLGQSDVWTMATPYGDTNWRPYARSRFLLNRDVFQAVVSPRDATEVDHLPCYMAGATQDGGVDDKLATFNQLIDSARSSGTWMTLLYHTILPTQDTWYGMVDLANIVGSTDHVKALGDVWADTVISVGAYWRAQALIAAVTPTTTAGVTTWTWTLPAHFPPGKYLRVKVDGGTLTQAGVPVLWDEHGYYEVALDPGTLSLAP